MNPGERLKKIDQAILQLEKDAIVLCTQFNIEPPQLPVPQFKKDKQPQPQAQQNKPAKAPKPQATASKQAFQFNPTEAVERYQHDKSLPPNMVCCTVTNYKNALTNTDADIENAYTDNEKHMRKLAIELNIPSSIFYRAPSDYYDWTLARRRDLLGPSSIHYLCKTMLMRNSKVTHEDYSDKMDSKYYFCVIQYSARLHNDKIGHAIRRLHPQETRPPSKNFNFRLTDPDVSFEITGQAHNGVTPLGSKNKVPIILSHKIAQLEDGFLWLGGGEVDLKWRVSVADFVKLFDPIIDDITYDEPLHDDKDFE